MDCKIERKGIPKKEFNFVYVKRDSQRRGIMHRSRSWCWLVGEDDGDNCDLLTEADVMAKTQRS